MATTRDATSTYFLGSEFFVYFASEGDPTTPFAYSTECTLSLSADQIDTSNKQSGIWASAMPGQLSWSISTSALYTTQANYATIYDLFSNRTKLKVKFATCVGGYDSSGNYNTTPSTGEASVSLSGEAYITSLELNAGNSEVASFSVEFTGEGKLTRAGASS